MGWGSDRSFKFLNRIWVQALRFLSRNMRSHSSNYWWLHRQQLNLIIKYLNHPIIILMQRYLFSKMYWQNSLTSKLWQMVVARWISRWSWLFLIKFSSNCIHIAISVIQSQTLHLYFLRIFSQLIQDCILIYSIFILMGEAYTWNKDYVSIYYAHWANWGGVWFNHQYQS